MKNKKILIICIISLVSLSLIGISVIFLLKNNNNNNGNTQNNVINTQEVENIENSESDNTTNSNDIDNDDEVIEKKEESKNTKSIEINNIEKNEKNTPKKTNSSEDTKVKNNTTNNQKNDTSNKNNDNSQPTLQVTIISEEEVKDDEVTTKYGTKIITTKTYKVINYSDGTTKKNYINSKTTYDKSTFNATTNDLKNEASTVSANNKSIYNEVVTYVNEYRAEANVNPIVLDDSLSLAATIRAIEIAYSSDIASISHTRPDGRTCFTVMDDLSISKGFYYGENIAAGYSTASSVAKGWYSSPGHRANMENNTYTNIGVGMYELGGIRFWVQLFTAH